MNLITKLQIKEVIYLYYKSNFFITCSLVTFCSADLWSRIFLFQRVPGKECSYQLNKKLTYICTVCTFAGMNDNFVNEYFGIGIQNGKTPENLGVLWRSAQNLGATFIFTIGNRYAKQASDTHDAVKAIPYFHYDTFEAFFENLPKGARLVGVELDEKAADLESFEHPRRCVYLLGAEDHGLSTKVMAKCHHLVKFKSEKSLNVAVAGTIIMYDRNLPKPRS